MSRLDTHPAPTTRPTQEVTMCTIAFDHVSKHYGPVIALEDVTVTVRPGRITAFLGANGSGKTTSMRVLLGLSGATSGEATIGGTPYHQLEHPLQTVGAVLDPGFHPRRSARNHLRLAAAQAAVPASRVDELLELVGLEGAARRWVGGYSLGMRQRLALASAMIGDPEVLVLDEPFNGLDPEGILTMRRVLREFADRGRTVFLSSHLLAEVARSADDAVIIDHGRVVSVGPVAELLAVSGPLLVTTPHADILGNALASQGAQVTTTPSGELAVAGANRDTVGRTALQLGVLVTDMRNERADLEDLFHTLTHPQGSTS
jgi:ABC-2 type transport system ATP-binding protein